MDSRRVGHGKAPRYGLAAGDVDQTATGDFVGPPSLRRIGLGEGGYVFRFAVHHCQAIEVAAILGRQPADKGRPPAGDEAVPVVERAEAAKGRVDEPQLVTRPGELMRPDLAGEV